MLDKISKSFVDITSNNEPLDFIDEKIVHDFFIFLEDIFNSLKVSKKNTDEDNLMIIQKQLQQLQSFSFSSDSIKTIDRIKPMVYITEELLSCYIKIYSTNKWYLQWK